ncbi:MAG: tetratricopeptide repeat protein [Pseudomonadota bacterium]|nr:hypothetical protein [Gammaproteobacteria bacterium]MEE2683610.1 tetratricopeptide repeat protein [Pseudomonadota bacterium]|tara:strand:- start:2944 stop:3774 length:831 start_codon:yes stop_codon:yes gene_type:complete
MHAYSTQEVADLLGENPNKIRAYAKACLPNIKKNSSGHYRFSFQDLVLLKAANNLFMSNAKSNKIWKSLRSLRNHLPHDRPLSSIRVAAHGDKIIVSETNKSWEVDSGQTIMNFLVKDIEKIAGPSLYASIDKYLGKANTADEWFSLALEFDQVGGQQDACLAYREALKINSSHTSSLINLGRILHKEKNYDEAEQLYSEALSVDPENSIAAFNLGVIFEDKGYPKDAIQAYKISIDIKPDMIDAHYNLALLYKKLGDEKSSLKHFSTFQNLFDKG